MSRFNNGPKGLVMCTVLRPELAKIIKQDAKDRRRTVTYILREIIEDWYQKNRPSVLKAGSAK